MDFTRKWAIRIYNGKVFALRSYIYYLKYQMVVRYFIVKYFLSSYSCDMLDVVSLKRLLEYVICFDLSDNYP